MAQYDEELINKVAEWIYHESSEPISEIEYLLKKSDAVGEYMDAVSESKEKVAEEDDMNYDISQADTRVALDWASIDGRLYDDILEAFVNEHGEGYYDDWVITANKEGGVDESIKKDGVERLKTLINFRI